MQLVRISSKGQFTIPAQMRDSLGISQGDTFLIKTNQGKLELEPIAYKSFDTLFSALHNKQYVSDSDVQKIVKDKSTSKNKNT
jgi:AbrB family looped-hinge helix DNA binding protein